MKYALLSMSAALLALGAAPVSAEVIEQDENGFVTRDVAVVNADTKAAWLALISPAKYWSSAHTWSGDAANMRMTPQAGGCFCEKIPEDPNPTRITLEGSVEHMRVIHAFPEKALRMSGALGPLQSEPVSGVFTVALSATETGGTRIVWEYAVGGRMRYETGVIAKAVDGVMSQQLNGLAALLGPVEPEPALGGAEAESPAEGSEEEVVDELTDEAAPSGGADEAAAPAKPSVADAFEDLADG
ncbi:SRPBCC family protein [Altererythrobacter sp. GH1-8]|uniref:SRPBCC family protein n=1 Tax=Altererythrobacter sp. GH1-8 TaxID=3349333 RepID=UPI00374D4DB3